MMPVIRITDATWDRLKRWAEPLEDSPEDAVRKVLEAAEDHLRCSQIQKEAKSEKRIDRNSSNAGKLSKGLKKPQEFYRRPILEALMQLGGRASVRDVLAVVEKKVHPFLTEVDLQQLSTVKDLRWENTAKWERWELVKGGLLKSDSPHGTWELSDRGFAAVKDRAS